MTTPTSSSLRSRAVRMSRGAPVLAAMSLNRRTPRTSSRITSNDHFSPTTSRAEAIEQRRGEAAREEAARDDAVVGGFGAEVAEVTPRAWHKGLAFPTHSGYGPPTGLDCPTHLADSSRGRATGQPAPRPRDGSTTVRTVTERSEQAVPDAPTGADLVEHPAYKLGRLAPHYDGLAFLEAIRSGELPPPPVAELLGFEIRELRRGDVTFALEPDLKHYSPLGAVHGGVTATLLDTVMGCAVHTV